MTLPANHNLHHFLFSVKLDENAFCLGRRPNILCRVFIIRCALIHSRGPRLCNYVFFVHFCQFCRLRAEHYTFTKVVCLSEYSTLFWFASRWATGTSSFDKRVTIFYAFILCNKLAVETTNHTSGSDCNIDYQRRSSLSAS